MKLTVLVDNYTYIDQYYLGEPAVSYYIEDGDARILFDVGYSTVYRENAKAMGLDLTNLTAVVLSHGHNDHTGGLSYLPKQRGHCRLIAHPQVLEEKQLEGLTISACLCRETLEDQFELCLSRTPVAITPRLTFLGEIPRTNDFENQKPVGCRCCEGEWKADFVADDSALVYQSPEGIYIITGCSHAGICNIIEYGKQVTGCPTVLGVIGGFHLLDDAQVQTERTARYLKEEGITQLYPCHCTSFAARAAIHRAVPVREVGVGLTLEWGEGEKRNKGGTMK
ncbi:MAG: MBL fold metallo-hydrolase [Lawsonibacter sp.]|jgi:7,8-dihydropterin-6-yl-methyl-4-(beta-D-ribofuranosyl)aminobenzene 5'-phosphate synthase